MVLDACVLFPTVMREVLVGCAAAGLYEPRWSARILEEWARATAKIGAEVIARGEVAVLRARWPGAEVQVPDGALARFWLPDPDDIHVLAAAVLGHADLIITLNAQDFPPRPATGRRAETRRSGWVFMRPLCRKPGCGARCGRYRGGRGLPVVRARLDRKAIAQEKQACTGWAKRLNGGRRGKSSLSRLTHV